MAKVGTTLARWVRHYPDAGDGASRTHYALRTDGKVVRKRAAVLSDGKWHDWGWKRVTLRGAPDTVAAVDALLTPAGFTRE